MKPVTLTIDNDLESLVVLQRAVGAFVEAAGAWIAWKRYSTCRCSNPVRRS